MRERALRTGEVARAAGVHVETLRYYERRGILEEPRRRESGYREYPPETVKIVRFIKRAQELGFRLDEVQELLALRSDGGQSCGDVAETARVKIGEIEEKIAALQAMRGALAELIDSCDEAVSVRECPILDALDEPAGRRS